MKLLIAVIILVSGCVASTKVVLQHRPSDQVNYEWMVEATREF